MHTSEPPRQFRATRFVRTRCHCGPHALTVEHAAARSVRAVVENGAPEDLMRELGGPTVACEECGSGGEAFATRWEPLHRPVSPPLASASRPPWRAGCMSLCSCHARLLRPWRLPPIPCGKIGASYRIRTRIFRFIESKRLPRSMPRWRCPGSPIRSRSRGPPAKEAKCGERPVERSGRKVGPFLLLLLFDLS